MGTIKEGAIKRLSGSLSLLSRIPALESGEYQIKVNMKLDSLVNSTKISNLEQNIKVAMQPFNLPLERFYSCYPINGSSGVYQDVLPHVVFNSRNLLWERRLDSDDGSRPWLALFIFSETEDIGKTTIIPAMDGQFPNSNPKIYYPKLDIKIQSLLKEKVNYDMLDIPKELFFQILPDWDDLPFTAHARKVSLDNKVTDPLVKSEWFSVLTTNRFPLKNVKNTAYLVSLEGFEEILKKKLNEQLLLEYETIRMFCLNSWSFFCEEKNFDFLDVTEKMAVNVLKQEIENLPTELNKIIDMGYTALNQRFREGSNSVCWYRSPLVPFIPISEKLDLCQYPDRLLKFDNELKMFDVSYSAAWQLGRLLGLQDQGYAQTIYKWRLKNKIKVTQEIQNEIVTAKTDKAVKNKVKTNDHRKRISKSVDLCFQGWEDMINDITKVCGMTPRYEMRHLLDDSTMVENISFGNDNRRQKQKKILNSFKLKRRG